MKSKFLLGLLAGTAVGVTLGILFAPDKGEKTRKKIAKAKDAAEKNFIDFVDTMKEKFSLTQDDVENVIHEVKSKAANASKSGLAKK